MNPRVALALVVLSASALGAAVLAASRGGEPDAATGRSGAPAFEGALMPAGLRAPDFALRDEEGRPVSLRRLRGRPLLITFLYTSCEDSCPAQAQTVRGALDQLGHDVPALAIAVDPPRDTPERARAFLAKQRALGRIAFVLGTREQLEPVWRGFGIRPQSTREEHQARFTLVDRRGFQRIGFPGEQATPERLAHDLRLLERERIGVGAG